VTLGAGRVGPKGGKALAGRGAPRRAALDRVGPGAVQDAPHDERDRRKWSNRPGLLLDAGTEEGYKIFSSV